MREVTKQLAEQLADAIFLLYEHKILTEEERDRCAVRWYNRLFEEVAEDKKRELP